VLSQYGVSVPHEGLAYVKRSILEAYFEYPTDWRKAFDTAIRILKGQSVPQEINLESR
jgi:hypothetical protein